MKKILIWSAIAIILIIVINALTKTLKKKIETTDANNTDGQKNYTPEDAKNAIEMIKQKYGKEIAARVEQIFRLETANFKSTAYKRTGSAGRLWFEKYDKGKPKWCVWLKPVFKDGVFVKNQIVPAETEGAKKYCYVVYPSVYQAMLGLANHLKRYGIDEGTMRWGYGTDREKGKKYLAQVTKITPKYA